MANVLYNGDKHAQPRMELPKDDELKEFRVLSVQSHVVSGYVGNRSAVFPLQVLGFDVDFINTVQLSNHLGYPSARGCALDEHALEDLYDGLHENRLDEKYTHLLTGFFRSKVLLLKLADIAKSLKASTPGLIYVCDPVMGDMGKMYVHADVLEVYRDVIIPLADIITPNQFEAEILTGVNIRDTATAKQAMEVLHRMGPQTVIISSSDLGDKDQLVAYASNRTRNTSLQLCMFIPRFPAAFNGTGDLFAALFLAWYAKSNGDLKHSCEATVSTLQSVLRRTLDHAERSSCLKQPVVWNSRELELRLIQSKADIEAPVITIMCQEA